MKFLSKEQTTNHRRSIDEVIDDADSSLHVIVSLPSGAPLSEVRWPPAAAAAAAAQGEQSARLPLVESVRHIRRII